jgi:hypothetical protein
LALALSQSHSVSAAVPRWIVIAVVFPAAYRADLVLPAHRESPITAAWTGQEGLDLADDDEVSEAQPGQIGGQKLVGHADVVLPQARANRGVAYFVVVVPRLAPPTDADKPATVIGDYWLILCLVLPP